MNLMEMLKRDVEDEEKEPKPEPHEYMINRDLTDTLLNLDQVPYFDSQSIKVLKEDCLYGWADVAIETPLSVSVLNRRKKRDDHVQRRPVYDTVDYSNSTEWRSKVVEQQSCRYVPDNGSYVSWKRTRRRRDPVPRKARARQSDVVSVLNAAQKQLQKQIQKELRTEYEQHQETTETTIQPNAACYGSTPDLRANENVDGRVVKSQEGHRTEDQSSTVPLPRIEMPLFATKSKSTEKDQPSITIFSVHQMRMDAELARDRRLRKQATRSQSQPLGPNDVTDNVPLLPQNKPPPPPQRMRFQPKDGAAKNDAMRLKPHLRYMHVTSAISAGDGEESEAQVPTAKNNQKTSFHPAARRALSMANQLAAGSQHRVESSDGFRGSALGRQAAKRMRGNKPPLDERIGVSGQSLTMAMSSHRII